MFTGIVEETGTVVAFTNEAEAWRLTVVARRTREGATLGDSIAINGCCLTIAGLAEDRFTFDVLEETRRVTSFAEIAAGSVVNLERSLAFGGKIGGHFVTGHIDGVGRIEVMEVRGKDVYLRVGLPATLARFIVQKGSIAIDGISLTVAEVTAGSFAVWLIPTTVQVTHLKTKQVGDTVNLETDLLGKYVEKFVRTPEGVPERGA